MTTVQVTEQNFDETIAGKIVFLDFWASWCGPCRTFAPVFEAAATRHPDVIFGKVDTEAQPGLAAAFEVRSIPTLAILRDGVLLFARPGALPASALDELVDKVRGIDMAEVHRSLEAEDEDEDGAAEPDGAGGEPGPSAS